MKQTIIVVSLILSACATQTMLSKEESVKRLSDLYLCKDVLGLDTTDMKKTEAKSRGLNCKSVVYKEEKIIKEQEDQKLYIKYMYRRRPTIKNVYDRVLSDSIDQYDIVENNGGSSIDLCVQAGMVKSAALQAKNSEFYTFWKNVEKMNCLVAR